MRHPAERTGFAAIDGRRADAAARRILTLDFEASCLPCRGRSFPIEVGVSDLHGNARSWLIRPMPEWRDWYWSSSAEALHGIRREQLEREGLPAAEVLALLAAATAGARVIADSYLDGQWLRTLADAAGREPPIALDHIASLLDELGTTPSDMRIAEEVVANSNLRRHRAREDAQRLGLLAGVLVTVAAGRRHSGAGDVSRAA